MTGPQAAFSEASREPKIASTSLAHLSIELGHLYMEDYAAGYDRLLTHFRRVKGWADQAVDGVAAELSGRRPRVSTCFLIDDYFTQFSKPAEVIRDILRAAEECEVRIDYIAREAGCAESDGGYPARLVEARLVADPPPGTNGARPPVGETGWLCNGQRTPGSGTEAMEDPVPWAPPLENARNRHSIFLDVELWDTVDDRRVWSCPFLAAVWQLLRLGLLRDKGAVVAPPRQYTLDQTHDWGDVPTVVQVNPKAHPFAAYRTLSILDSRFLHVEHAVRTILSQVAVERDVAELVAARAGGEKLFHPASVVDRMEYVFTGPRWNATPSRAHPVGEQRRSDA